MGVIVTFSELGGKAELTIPDWQGQVGQVRSDKKGRIGNNRAKQSVFMCFVWARA